MKKLLLLVSLVAFNANAGFVYVPNVISHDYQVNLGVGGSAVSYTENYSQNGPIRQLAGELASISPGIQNALNTQVAQEAAADGASFQYGVFEGDPFIQVNPRADGTALISLSGVSYRTAVKKKIRWLGISWATCTATLSVPNISIIAQYGSVNGQLVDETIGLHGSPSVNTDCSSFLSWLLPGIGGLFINGLEDFADRELLDAIKSAMNSVKDKLLFRPDQNFLSTLNGLIPQDKTITLPDGVVFPIGQYVRNNIAYFAANSSFTIEISRGLGGIPERYQEGLFNESADVLYLALSSPALSFDLSVTEKANVYWVQFDTCDPQCL